VLVKGGISLADLAPEGISRPEVLQLCEKTMTFVDETLVVEGGGVGPARVIVELGDGRRLAETAHTPRGAPDRPMSPVESERKFMDCIDVAGFNRAQAESLMKTIYSLETLADASVLPVNRPGF
jgi:2-methylcitrate dehydratase PrpD